MDDCLDLETVVTIGAHLGTLSAISLQAVQDQIDMGRVKLCDACHLDRANFAYLWISPADKTFEDICKNAKAGFCKPGGGMGTIKAALKDFALVFYYLISFFSFNQN